MSPIVESQLDPFSNVIVQPKLYDGKVSRSSGIKLRASGEAVLPSGISYMVLIPGLTNNITGPGLSFLGNFDYSNHLDTVLGRTQVKEARLVGSALRLSMINSADQNEGYWEAIRFPSRTAEFEFGASATGHLLVAGASVASMDARFLDLVNNPTYQTGKIRDLHRYQFKLNSEDNDHQWTPMKDPPQLDSFLDENWDCILIKLHGRNDASNPTVLKVDVVSNQEIIYQEGTALFRLMTPTMHDPAFDQLLVDTRYDLPAHQMF